MTFQYKRRSAGDIKRRAEGSGNWARLIQDEFDEFRPKLDQSYTIRIGPPTWKDPVHYAYDVWANYRVGPEREAFLSHQKMLKQPDAVLELIIRLQKHGSRYEEQLKEIQTRRRCGSWILDRDDDKVMWKAWLPPWTVDRDISALCIDKSTGEPLLIDDPDEGFDVSFDVKKKGGFPTCVNFEVARSRSPIHRNSKKQDGLLQFLVDNPFPTCLKYYSYEHINALLIGQGTDDSDEGEEVPQTRQAARQPQREEEEEVPPTKSRRARFDDDDDDSAIDEKPRSPRQPIYDDDEDDTRF